MRDNQLVGLVLGYMTRSRCFLLQHFSARAIVNGGPLLAEDITQEELKLLISPKTLFGESVVPIYVETRNFRDYSPWREAFERMGWTYCPHYDVWAHVDGQWRERLHESKTRKVKNMLMHCEIMSLPYAPEYEVYFSRWYQLLNELYRSKVHRPLPSSGTLLAGWKSGMALLLVRQQEAGKLYFGKDVDDTQPYDVSSVMGGGLLPHDNQWAYEYYVCGPTIVTYAMLEWCEKNGIQYLDMMGAGEPDIPYGVRDFKLQMGGALHDFGRFLYIQSPLRYRLGKLILSFRH